MAGIENLLNSKGAYATRRADLDRQIAELQNQLGYAGDGSFEGEMGWWDYAVHGDRSGLDAYASIKQNEQIQKRQFAENLVEQQNRAMRSLRRKRFSSSVFRRTDSSTCACDKLSFSSIA